MEKIIKKEKLTYKKLEEYLQRLKAEYPFLKVATCGKTVMGKELFALCFGSGKRKVLYVGGTHATEWITSLFLLDFCESLLQGERQGTCLSGYSVKEIFDEVTFIAIPMLNPDGVDIALSGISGCGKMKEEIYDICKFNFSQWNANANGVDLNHNFNADWYSLRDFEEQNGITSPSPRRYGGPYPESEPESKAIVEFLRNVKVDRLYSFHSQGEEIFYDYKNIMSEKGLIMAKALQGVSGYTLVNNEGHYSSGGLKDWFIGEFRKPGFTIEIGKGKNPLPLEEYDYIYNSALPLAVLGLIL